MCSCFGREKCVRCVRKAAALQKMDNGNTMSVRWRNCVNFCLASGEKGCCVTLCKGVLVKRNTNINKEKVVQRNEVSNMDEVS